MSEQLFAESLLALHTLSYYLLKSKNKYLYEQDVSCATSTLHRQNAGNRTDLFSFWISIILNQGGVFKKVTPAAGRNCISVTSAMLTVRGHCNTQPN
jgi:hypothetical protein